MKKNKSLLVILVVLVITGAVALTCFAAGVFDKGSHYTWYESAKNGGLDDVAVEKIKTGMSFEEVVAVIGKPQRDIGSGVWLMEWDMKSGKKLVIAFNSLPGAVAGKGGYSASDLIAFDISVSSDEGM